MTTDEPTGGQEGPEGTSAEEGLEDDIMEGPAAEDSDSDLLDETDYGEVGQVGEVAEVGKVGEVGEVGEVADDIEARVEEQFRRDCLEEGLVEDEIVEGQLEEDSDSESVLLDETEDAKVGEVSMGEDDIQARLQERFPRDCLEEGLVDDGIVEGH